MKKRTHSYKKIDLANLGKILSTLVTKKESAKFATKKDLARFATKKDLTKYATKKDLAKFATKKDLARFATKKDLVALREEMHAKFEESKRHMGVLYEDVVSRIDLLIENISPISEIVGKHEERLTKVEEDVGILKLAVGFKN